MRSNTSTVVHASPVAERSRLSSLDNLRVWLTVLVVLHHLAITYAVVGPWYYVEYTGDPLATGLGAVFVIANQAYFMGCFFLVSGYFTPASLDRKAVGPFVRGRLLRLGVPLLAFLALVGPLVGALGRFSTLPPGAGRPDTDDSFDLLGLLNAGPLWFVEVLLLLGLGYAVLRLVRGPAAAPGAPGVPQPPAYWQVGVFALGLAAVTWLVRLVMPMGFSFPVLGWPTPAYLPQYVSFFVAGVLAYRRGWFHAVTDRMGRVGWLAAGVVSLAALPVALAAPEQMLGGPNIHAFAFALWDSTFAVGVCLGLVTLFRKRFDTSGRLLRFASANAFAVYILHALVITALAVAVRDVHLHPVLKFAVVAPFGVAASFAVAALVRRIPGVRKVV